MVSSKCCQVESPSPFRFLAALMPPWAQTEWERFTGTIENRSTSPPISAILITAARPARPPPTTIIFGAAIIYESDLQDLNPSGPKPGLLLPLCGTFSAICEAVLSPFVAEPQRIKSCYFITIFSDAFESRGCGGVLRKPAMLAAPINTRPNASARQM